MNLLKDFASRYHHLLSGEFDGINLTRIETPEDFFNKQILDSVLPQTLSPIFKESLEKTNSLLDIGFGGGFPILPLAYNNPTKNFFGFDARLKKVETVSLIAEKLGINNVRLFHQRYEEVLFDKNLVITFKAVGKVHDLLSQFSTNKNLYVFFYKGPNFYELEDIGRVEDDWELIEEVSYDVPGTEGRMLLGFKNKNVLRGTNNLKKIKFSDLL